MNSSKCVALPTTAQLVTRNSSTKARALPGASPFRSPPSYFGTRRCSAGFELRKCRREGVSQTSTRVRPVAAAAGIELNPVWRVSEAAPPNDDVLVSVLFVVATLALVVLTAGVAYLSFSSWFDERQEKQDRENFESREKYNQQMSEFQSSQNKKTSKEKQPVRRATPKGFGKE